MRLPTAFFNEKSLGDVMQRVEDQKRIEVFLSTQLSSILFSVVNIVIYTAMLRRLARLLQILLQGAGLLLALAHLRLDLAGLSRPSSG